MILNGDCRLQSNMLMWVKGILLIAHFQDEDMSSWILAVSNYFIFFYLLFLCRNLSKPIAVQYKEKEDRYVDTYKVALVSIEYGALWTYAFLFVVFIYFSIYFLFICFLVL